MFRLVLSTKKAPNFSLPNFPITELEITIYFYLAIKFSKQSIMLNLYINYIK